MCESLLLTEKLTSDKVSFCCGCGPGRLTILQWMPLPPCTHGQHALDSGLLNNSSQTQSQERVRVGGSPGRGLREKWGDGYDQNNLCDILRELINSTGKEYAQTSLK